jgi:hypothetical protein
MNTLQNLFEDNLAQLSTNIERGFPRAKARQNRVNMVNVTKTEFFPYPQQYALLVRADVRGETRTYNTRMLFRDVDYQDADNENVVTFKATNGEDYHIVPVFRDLHNVELSCTCMDYAWRFWMQNYQKDTQFGQGPGPYRRKTPPPPQGRPYANPMEVTGMCKHLIKLSEQLEKDGILKT